MIRFSQKIKILIQSIKYQIINGKNWTDFIIKNFKILFFKSALLLSGNLNSGRSYYSCTWFFWVFSGLEKKSDVISVSFQFKLILVNWEILRTIVDLKVFLKFFSLNHKVYSIHIFKKNFVNFCPLFVITWFWENQILFLLQLILVIWQDVGTLPLSDYYALSFCSIFQSKSWI